MENLNMLSQLGVGESCRVVSLDVSGSQRRRMLDLGLVQGTKVVTVQKSPSGDPKAYSIRGAVVALRDEDADKIIIRKITAS